MARFGGIIVPTVTLFHEDGSLDWEANGRFIDRLIGEDVDAIFALGTTGEAAHLTVEERAEFIRWIAREFRGRIPLLVGVSDTATSVSCELARVAADAGVDGVVVIGPYYWTPGERHLYAHFRAVADATPLPVLLYNYPQFVGVNLSVDLVWRLADDCPNIVGIKETLDSGTHMRQMVNGVKSHFPDFSVLCGHDNLGLFALTAGLDGMVSSTANVAPEVFVHQLRSYRNGEFEAAQAASSRIGRMVEAYGADPCGAAVVKTALHLRGWIDHPTVRLPALALPKEGVTLVRQALIAGGLSLSVEVAD